MKTKCVCICVVVLSVLSPIALADTIEVAYVAVEAGGNKNVTLDGGGHTNANGLLAIDTRNPSGPLANLIGADTWAYCCQIDAYADFPFNIYNVATLETDFGSDKAGLISQLWAQNYDNSWQSDTYIYYGGNQGGWQSGEPSDTAENRQALAMVLGIYEIIYDFSETLSSLDLSSDRFIANSTNPTGAISIAQGWLDSLVLPGEYIGPSAQLLSLTSASCQNFIVEVPEPITLCFLGLGGLLLRRKKMRS